MFDKNFLLTGLLLALVPSAFIHAETNPIHNSACATIASALPPRGTRLSPKDIDEVIAELPGSWLSLQPTAVQGLTLESTYLGSLNCQLPKLFETSNGRHEQIAIPERFQGGEGDLCHDDRVRLVAVAHAPALMETALNEANRFDLDVATRIGSSWSRSCRLSIRTTPHYGTTDCRGNKCSALEDVAVKAANSRHIGDLVTQAYEARELSAENREKWRITKQLANESNLNREELPTFGQDKFDGRLRTFWDGDTAFMPIELGNELLVGIIGTAGFGSHFGSDKLFAAYRLTDAHFEPIAGFYLSVVDRSLDGYETTDLP